MTPISPVVPYGIDPEVVYAKDQPQYLPLPAHRAPDGTVTTRWRLSFSERLRVLFGGSVWLSIMTFNEALQPVMLITECPIAVEK